MTRGQLAKRCACHIETVRYYEKIGVLPEPPRSANGYRTYDRVHERRLRFVLRARQLGFTVDEVRGLLALVDGGRYTCSEVRDLTEGHLTAVRARIDDLQRLAATLERTVAACDGGSTPDCPIIDALLDDR